jgi:transcriptional regulator with XRE-family HTH domain
MAPLRRSGTGMLMSVDATNDIAEFLTSRRARVTPERVGLPTYGARRVKGLRREEVASLAGVSVEYYKRLERGNAGGVSDSVLEALARALALDDAERAHLFDLARAANPVIPKRRRAAQQRVRPAVLRILDSIGAPAIVRNSRVDYLAANPLGRALYAPVFDSRRPPGAELLAAGRQRELKLEYEVMDVSADDGLTIAAYSAEPGSRSAEALDLLASWTATLEPDPAPADQ